MEEKAKSPRSVYEEYRHNIVYCPVEYEDDFPVYCCEYEQKSFSNKKLHFHNGFEIGVCVEGEGIFLVANKVYKFTKNCVTFISSAQPHIAQSSEESPSRWKFLTIDWEKMFGTKDFEVRNNVVQDDELAQLVLMVYQEMENKEENYRNVVSHLLNALVYRMFRNENKLDGIPQTSVSPENVYASIRYICNNYNKKFTIEDLAAVNNYSVNYFRKLFKDQTGMTPLDYIINVRLQMASVLLRATNKSVLEVANESGFSTLSSFNRYFKNKYEMTPSQWRKKWKQS